MRLEVKKLLSVILIMCMVIPLSLGLSEIVSASTNSKGDGSSNNPYKIYNAEDLKRVGTDLNGHYIQMNDIDLGNIPFPMIGGQSTSTAFRGVYDGGSYTIKNLKIASSSTTTNIGMFAITENAILKNIHFENISISGGESTSSSYMGTLVGDANKTEITNCTVRGEGYIQGGNTCGGLVGRLSASTNHMISNCSVEDISVTGRSHAGGITGMNFRQTITRCYTTCDVTSTRTDSYAGGIVTNASNTTISECFSTGKITGGAGAGGINGGYNVTNVTINNCFSVATINANNAGGIVGTRAMSPYINNSYFAGKLEGNENYGLAKAYYATNSYFDGEINNNVVDYINSKQTSAMIRQETYNKWDFNNIWKMDASVSDYPILRWNSSAATGVAIIGNSNRIDLGESLELKAILLDTGDDIDSWAAEPTGIVSLSENGDMATIVGLEEGDVVIRVRTTNGAVATYPVRVGETDTKLSEIGIELEIGESCRIAGLLDPASGISKADPTLLTWSSSNSDIASVDEYGEVTAESIGLAWISAIDENGVEAIVYVQVVPEGGEVFELSELGISLDVGDSCRVIGLLDTSFGMSKADPASLKWTSNKPEVASVDDSGMVNAKKIGMTLITVEDENGNKASIYVLVEGADVDPIDPTEPQPGEPDPDADIFGVEVDLQNNEFTRLAGAENRTAGTGFDSINAFGGRRRCIVADDGNILAYYGDDAYSETGKLEQAVTIGSITYPEGTSAQVMVYQPKFYYRVVPLLLDQIEGSEGSHMRRAQYYVSDTPKEGFKVHPAFIKEGTERDYILIGAYEGCLQKGTDYNLTDEQNGDFTMDTGDRLSSIADAKPVSGLTQRLTRRNCGIAAENRGENWSQEYVAISSATQLLMLIEYSTFDIQTAIGMGVVSKTDDGKSNMSENTGQTSHLGNASGMAIGEPGYVSVSYRGQENPWGNIWTLVDGINVWGDGTLRGGIPYIADHNFVDSKRDENYRSAGFTLANYDGYVSAFGYGNEEFDWLFLASETSKSKSFTSSYNFVAKDLNRYSISAMGGAWNSNLTTGGYRWNTYNIESHRVRTFGGRLVYVP